MIEIPASLYRYPDAQVSELVVKTVTSIEYRDANVDYRIENDSLVFYCSDGSVYLMTHEQDCCEGVYIESIHGDLKDLVGVPLVMAEDISSELENEPALENYDESYTWTFYKFATIKGYVTIRWYGSSNGYYSESVDFKRIVDAPKEE